jgi:hypothetical protein
MVWLTAKNHSRLLNNFKHYKLLSQIDHSDHSGIEVERKFLPPSLLTNGTECYYNYANWHFSEEAFIAVIIRTRVFEMADEKYCNLSALAVAMGLSVSQVYRVREGKRGINEKFIVGAKKAFPDSRLDELFYFTNEKPYLK